MKKIKAQTERVIGFLNGKRIKTTAKKWLEIMENPENSVVFKEDNDIEQEVETRGYTEEEIRQSTKEYNGVEVSKADEEGTEAVGQRKEDS